MAFPMADPERTSETERRHATVLFGDITGFTTLSESLDPEEVYGIITGCLKRIDGIARNHGGLAANMVNVSPGQEISIAHRLKEILTK